MTHDLTGDAVSVVIPTTLRSSVARAVASARSQAHAGATEVVVVVDRDPAACSPRELAHVSAADTVLFTGGGGRAGRARNLGVEAATGAFVAFLDDDDEWLPGKVARQVQALRDAERAGRPTVVGSRVVQRHARTGGTSVAVPRVTIRPGQAIEDYLFQARRPEVGRASFFTSTLLMRRELARAVPWSPGLRRHQDWDWLVRAQRDAHATFVQVPETTVVYTVGSVDSISASPDWQSSLEWARLWRAEWDRRTYADFVAGQCLRYAVQSRSAAGVRACLGEIAGTRSRPSAGPSLMAAGSLVPRRAIERVLAGRRTAVAL